VRRASRPAAALVLALLTSLAVAWPVWAHAELLSSEPAPGATVPAGLRTLTLTFNEPVAEGSQVVVYAEQFQPVAGVTNSAAGPVLTAHLDSGLGQGLYTVQWRAVGTDGHPVEGSYQFGVSAPFGAGMGPRIVFFTGLIVGTLSLVALVILTRMRRR
jgi:methionine-rich copper-binding protein CopC